VTTDEHDERFTPAAAAARVSNDRNDDHSPLIDHLG
jgi:hypothetical protein